MQTVKKIVAAGGLVINTRHELLMIFRRGKWDLPKGKLDKGENIEACALREVMEETGLKDIILGKPVTVSHHTYFDPYLKEDVTKETHWYLMHIEKEQPLTPQTEEDITGIEWVDQHTLKNHLANSYDNIIAVIRIAGWLSS